MERTTNDLFPASLRIAFAGDSITWVDGMLDDGFAGAADSFIRSACAETVTHDRMSVFGASEVVHSRKFYHGSAVKLTGVGSGASFQLTGDELCLVQAMERTGSASASMIELYVDGVLFDTFSNYSEAPSGEQRLRFVGDGTTHTFDLGRPFTYGHRVSVDGVEAAGELNKGGYGASFPAQLDYRVIRQYVEQPGQAPEVHHVLHFREPVASGAVIEVLYRFGEAIAYAKTTVGETGERIDDPLESRYGEGGVAFDPARPVSVSSGLDFRMTDERAVRTWTFPEKALRTFELKIRGFDPQGGERGEPYFLINFATNRFHRLMNAGIGGWTANLFNTDKGHRSTSHVSAWKPDIVFIGLGTNDDWEAGNGFAASRRADGLTEEEVRRLPALMVKNCRYEGPDRYSVETAELVVEAAAERKLTIDAEGAELADVKPGDLIVVGDYYGDNRNVQSRILASWDPHTRTARFAEPLRPTPLTSRVGDYAGQAVRIKRIDGYAAALQQMIDTLQREVPQVRIALFETGLSNFYTRLLTGYPELIRRIAERGGHELVNVYQPLIDWQYAQPLDKRAYIGAGEAVASTGASSYPLLDAEGRDIGQSAGYQLRNWSVRVNGQERYGNGCRIEGGYAIAFRHDLPAESLAIDNWNGRSRNPAMAYRFIPARLVFARDVPEQGAIIEAAVSSGKWSNDDAHLGLPGGSAVYAEAVKGTLARMIGSMRADNTI